MTSKAKDQDLALFASHESRPDISPFAILRKFSAKLDSLGVETRGIERILPHERSTDKRRQLITVMGLWLSACGGLSSMSSFYLGPLTFGLGLRKTLICGLLGEFLGCAVAAYCSIMGPMSGCRQMVGARFLFGWWAVKAVCVASIVGVMGWSVVNCVVGGQILSAMSEGKVPLIVAIVVIAVTSLLAAVGGIRHLMRVEALLSLPVNFAFLLLYVVASKKFKYLSFSDSPDEDAATVTGNAFSFFSLCYSITATWGGIALDYYVLFPENTPDSQVFMLTFFGILIPTTFVGVISILIGNVAMNYAPWADAYAELGMGGLLNAAFLPWGGGGKFLLAVIFLSLISNNILNTYLAAFGVQLIGVPLAKVPRYIWAVILTAVYLICAIVGRYKFSVILGNFLPMVGYWISMYFTILLEENVIFRTKRFLHLYTAEFDESDDLDPAVIKDESYNRRFSCRKTSCYNFSIWNDTRRLTHGFAASFAFLCGAAGAAVGMSQVYWVGPLARKVGGHYGGDIAMWLCIGFSGLSYPGLRYLELRKYGR